ncbi:MAG: KUP/HAK/KT family potassium transporter [Breznakibacter sp.]|nr:KUP/HAK/KT family potassium transporter [Breznakibacter sp.]
MAHVKDKLTSLSFIGVVVSLGIIYGDIGTSPLYVLKAIMGASSVVNESLILGALSCIIWTLTLQTTVKYVLITLKADNRGEGGIFSLFALLRRKKKWLFIFAIIGGSTLLADGIITPAITVVSAIEGLKINNPDIAVIPIVLMILTLLFVVQQFGTSFLGKSFGPLMFIWFTMLGVLGITALVHNPMVIRAFNPMYGINLLMNHPGGFLLLGAVFLCTTGAEALYTDLGHCGIRNIRVSWVYVKAMLILNYLGQGAWVLSNLDTITAETNPFYGIMASWFLPYGIIMATIAAVIASQALISCSYTLISEAMSLNFWPKMLTKYPSSAKGQMYIPILNWFLYGACVVVVLFFQTSSAMEAAYGLSITITMLMTSILMVYYLMLRRTHAIWISVFALVYFVIEGAFLIANLQKFMHGGYFTVILASFFGIVMAIMYYGRKIRNRFITFDKIGPAIPVITALSRDHTLPKFCSQLVYTTHADNKTDIEAKTIYSIITRQPKRADVYWFLHVDIVEDPFMLEYKVTTLSEGVIYRIDFYIGFKVQPKINEYFAQVLEHMAQEGRFDPISSHPSLRQYDVRTDFRYVQIDRRVTRQIDLPFVQKWTLNLYFILKGIAVSDVFLYGLDSSLVTVEKIPLTIKSKNKVGMIRLRE